MTPGLTQGLHVDPVQVDVAGDALDILARGLHFFVRRADGSIFTDTVDPGQPDRIPPSWEIAGGDSSHLCARLPDATVRCWGDNRQGQVGDGTSGSRVSSPRDVGLTCIQRVARGPGHTCALRSDGTVWCWGQNSFGESGQRREASDHCGEGAPAPCILRPRQVDGIDDAVGLFVGDTRTCVTRSDRSVWCWGDGAELPRIASEWMLPGETANHTSP